MVDPGWDEIADGYRFYLVTQDKSPETIRTYIGYCRLSYQWFRLRQIEYAAVTERQFGTFIEAIGKAFKPYTKRNYISANKNFFGHYAKDELGRKDDPTWRFSTKRPKTAPKRPFSRSDVQMLLDAATSSADKAMIAMLTGSAIRVGELVKIRVQDIGWETGEALVFGKGSKERWVALTPAVLITINRYLDGRASGPIFLSQEGTPLTRNRAWKRLVALGAKAGVVNVYPHRFRTTYAIDFLDAGGDLGALQSLMGHQDIATTERYAGYSKARRGLDQMRRFDLAGRFNFT